MYGLLVSINLSKGSGWKLKFGLVFVRNGDASLFHGPTHLSQPVLFKGALQLLLNR